MFHRFVNFRLVASTHLWLKAKLESGEHVCGMVVTANEQSFGRGQGENIWHSQAGQNLLFSACWCPSNFPAVRAFDISVAASLALVEMLDAYQLPSICIKWPNDIWSGERKLAGILVSNTLQQGKISHAIISIGLNINQIEFPDDLPNPVSMRLLKGVVYDREEVLVRTLDLLSNRLAQIEQRTTKNMWELYHHRLYGLMQKKRFLIAGQEQWCTISGVDEFGRLMLKGSDGTEVSYDLSEARMFQ